MLGLMGGQRGDRAVVAGLVVATLLGAALHLVLGAGYVLDDWYLLRNAHFEGAWLSAGAGPGAARPASYPIFAIVFGLFGHHPLPGVLLLAAVNGACAILTYRLLERFMTRSQAALASLLWVLLPTHLSTQVWLTCTIIAVSQLALTGALLIGLRQPRPPWALPAAFVLLAVSALAYEASLPVAGVGAVVLPWLLRRRIDWPFIATAATSCGLSALWILTHWFEGKSLQTWADPGKLLQGNFGWGVVPGGAGSWLATPIILAAVAGMTLSFVRIGYPRLPSRSEDWLVLGGSAVMVLGLVPFARYFYEPLGAGDRVNYLSALGASIVWVGLFAGLARIDRRIAGAAVVGLLILGTAARWERTSLWSTAGQDAEAIASAVVEQLPEPEGTVVLGPAPVVRENVAAFLDISNVQGALSIAYGTPHADVAMTYDHAAWSEVAEDLRFDIRVPSELDDVELLGR